MAASEEAWEIVEAYVDTQAFPGIPLTGRSVDDLDARAYAGIKAVRIESGFIEASLRQEVREARARELQRMREERGRGR